MALERITESITLEEMKCSLVGEMEFGKIFAQGDVNEVDKLKNALCKAGGKPLICPLSNYDNKGVGRAKPEFIVTFKKDITTIVVVECKKSLKKHYSEKYDHPKDYAIDGVLYYAKYLKDEYNVIAIAVSGTKKDQLKVDTFYWPRNQSEFMPISKAKDTLLSPEDYLNLVKGQKLQKKYSLDEIRQTAIQMHNTLREIKVSEKHKPIFIAGILIALENKEFCDEYSSCTSFSSVINRLNSAIDDVLSNSDIKKDKIDYIKSSFKRRC